MITTATEIKYVDNSFKVFNALEVDLEGILVEEFEQGLLNDLNNFL